MDTPRALLLSSSRVAGAGFLDAYADWLAAFLAGARRVWFLPYAGVMTPHDDYAARACDRLAALGVPCAGLHSTADPRRALAEADAVVVGGGNTFQLLATLQRLDLLAPIAARVGAGMRYVGWSAGANLAGPTIRTTNDMPVVEPAGFRALGLVPYQINPHYNNALPPGHQGETRDERLAEFLALSPSAVVAGLREGSALEVRGARTTLLGTHPLRVFRAGVAPCEFGPGDVSEALRP